MNDCGQFEDFSLLGGPVHEFGRRLKLVRGRSNSFPLGVAIASVLWLVLGALALSQREEGRLFRPEMIAAHVRLLLAVPLCFLCEAWFDPKLRDFIAMLVRSGVAPEAALPDLERATNQATRVTRSIWPDLICLLIAVGILVITPTADLTRLRSTMGVETEIGQSTLAGGWYWFVAMTVVRFLLFRWLFRLMVWWRLLWRIERLKLTLTPTHPDGVAGLGYLAVVQTQFIPLVVALSAVQSATLAEAIWIGAAPLESAYPMIAAVVALEALLFVAPLFLFLFKLWKCKQEALASYMIMGSQYVNSFDAKWVHAKAPADEPLLGTADIQSLADLSNSMEIVRGLRLAPVSNDMAVSLAVAALIPMAPLWLLSYPMDELLKRLFSALAGG
jgi:hypothetical protein